MLLKSITFLFIYLSTIQATTECQFHEDVQPFQTVQTDNSLLYLYIPVRVIGIAQNSIEIFNELGQVLSCFNMKDFKEETNITWENPSFFMIKHIKDDLYAIGYVSDKEPISVAFNNAYYIITDEYFNIK